VVVAIVDEYRRHR